MSGPRQRSSGRDGPEEDATAGSGPEHLQAEEAEPERTEAFGAGPEHAEGGEAGPAPGETGAASPSAAGSTADGEQLAPPGATGERTTIVVRPSRAAANPLDAAREVLAAGASEDRPTLEKRFERRTPLKLPARHNPRLAGLVERLNEDEEVYALWTAANVTAVDRLRMSDHGPVHVQIVANSALRLLRLLVDAGVTPSIVFDYGLDQTDAEVVVSLAALFHDVGMSIHREDHESFSLFVAQPILRRHLAEVYDPPADAIVRSEILGAIIAHRSGGTPLTVEAGILRIADALDMEQGRSRIPFEAGSMSIHAVSAAAVEEIHIERGDATPVLIRIEMSNSAGVFQVDQLLRRKLAGSGLEEHIQVEAHIEGETEKRLVTRFRL